MSKAQLINWIPLPCMNCNKVTKLPEHSLYCFECRTDYASSKRMKKGNRKARYYPLQSEVTYEENKNYPYLYTPSYLVNPKCYRDI